MGNALVLRGAAVFVLAGVVPAASSQQGTSAPASLVFDGVTVVDVEQGTLVADQRVVITGNHIKAMGPAGTLAIPKGSQVIDARRQYLIPGLWDMHVHVRGYPQVFYPLLIANGITGVRDMNTLFLDSLLRWRREILAGTRVGPRSVLTGGYLGVTPDGAVPMTDDPFPIIEVVTPERARTVVDSLKAAGVDFIKVRDGLSSEVYFAVAAEARRIGIPFAGHYVTDLPPEEISDAGQRSIEHVLGISDISSIGDCLTDHSFPNTNEAYTDGSDAGCATLLAHFARNGTWLTPTFVFWHYLYGGVARDRLRFWPDTLHRIKEWNIDPADRAPIVGEKVKTTIARMKRTGLPLPLLAGTDADPSTPENTPGFSLHDELAAFVKGGLTPAEALRTATLNPAKYLEATDSLGTVAPGKLADLVLLDADPLVDIANAMKIRAVVANGRYFDRAALDALIAGVERQGRGRSGTPTP